MYIGEFYNIYDNKFLVTIDNYDLNNSELTFSDNPVIISMDNSDDIIFKPYKGTHCTIEIITPEYYFDLYSTYPHDRKVEIKDENNEIIWVGYITPNIYNQGFSQPYELVSIECIDGISTLQYFDYIPVNGNGNESIVSLYDILVNIFYRCECYADLIYPNSIFPVIDGNVDYNSDIIQNIYLSEKNFFDEDNKPLKYNEVLEYICKYLNLTCIAHKDKLYLLDYAALKNGYNEYKSIQNQTVLYLSDFVDVGEIEQYAGNNHDISLDTIYNKVSVKDSLYNIDELFPDLYDASNLFSITENATLNSKYNYFSLNKYWYQRIKEIDEKGKSKDRIYYSNFLLPKDNISLYCYTAGIPLGSNEKYEDFNQWWFTPVSYPMTLKPNDIQDKQYIFGTVVDFASTDYDNGTEGDLNSTTNLVLYFNSYCDNPLNTQNVPLIDVNYNTNTLLMSTETCKNALLIKGNFQFVQYETGFCPVIDYNYNPYSDITSSSSANYIRLDRARHTYDEINMIPKTNLWYKDSSIDFGGRKNFNDMFIKISLCYGGKYYNGSEWVDDFCMFDLPLSNGREDELHTLKKDFTRWDDDYNQRTKGKQFAVKNNVKWYQHIDENGFLIELPDKINPDSNIQVTFYTFSSNNYYNQYTVPYRSSSVNHLMQRTESIWITDFEIKAVNYDKTLIYSDKYDIERLKNNDESNDSDTLYTNIVDEDYINEFEDEFKICTFDNKKPNYSCVYLVDNNTGELRYLDETYQNGTGEICRQEEHYITKIVYQYTNPARILEVELHKLPQPYSLFNFYNLPFNLMLLDGFEYNIKYDVNKLILKEAQ